MAERSLLEAARLKLPALNSGDAHSVEMIGRYWIETHRPLSRADDIRGIVLAGEYDLRTADE